MATTQTYTITTTELAALQDKWQTMQRLPEFQQLVDMYVALDAKYGVNVTGGNVNSLPQRSLNQTTRVVSVNTADVALEHQFPFPFGTH